MTHTISTLFQIPISTLVEKKGGRGSREMLLQPFIPPSISLEFLAEEWGVGGVGVGRRGDLVVGQSLSSPLGVEKGPAAGI